MVHVFSVLTYNSISHITVVGCTQRSITLILPHKPRPYLVRKWYMVQRRSIGLVWRFVLVSVCHVLSSSKLLKQKTKKLIRRHVKPILIQFCTLLLLFLICHRVKTRRNCHQCTDTQAVLLRRVRLRCFMAYDYSM